MKSLRVFAFLILIAFSFGSFQLSAAPKTLDEINAEQKKKEEEKKAAEEAKKAEEVKKKEEAAKKAAEEKQKAKEEAAKKKAAGTPNPAVYQQTPAQETAKTYSLVEDVIGIPKPFVMTQIDNAALMNADQKAVELFEATTKKESAKNVMKNPSEVIKLWSQLAEITTNNPFVEIAKARFYEWHSVVALLNKHQENIDKISKLIPTNAIPAEQKVSLVSQHLDEFGVMFGTDEILNITKKSDVAAKIVKNEAFRAKIKEIQIARCNQNSGKDCFMSAKFFAANEEEKITYFTKACELKYQAGCNEVKKIEADAEAEKARIAAEEKAKKEQELKNELNQAGRKKRLIIATSTFVPGVVLTILGGVSLAGMKKAKKDRDRYFDSYNQSSDYDEMNYFRKKTQDADKKRKTYMGLGFAGIGAGVALIATGITFYCIEFEEEKEVKKKYNLSFGASPIDGTLQFAINW